MSRSASPPRRAILTWILLLGALLALLVFAQNYGERKREREVRPLLFANTGLATNQLAFCLAEKMPLTGKSWDMADGSPVRIVRWNTARGLRIAIIDAAAKGRRVEISTVGARPLRDQEAEALRRCLAGG
jgi:hypothetical protein